MTNVSSEALLNLRMKLHRSFVESDTYTDVLSGVRAIKAQLDYLDQRLATPDLSDQTPIEGKLLAVAGAPGVGKNTTLNRALSEEGLIEFQEPTFRGGKTLKISMPSTVTRAGLAVAILEKLTYKVTRPTMKAEEAWQLARIHLAANEVRVIWIDEVDDIVDATNRIEFQKFGNLFRSLVQASGSAPPLCVILSGLNELEKILDDPLMYELKRRTRLVRFGLITEGDAPHLVEPIIGEYCAIGGLTHDFVDLKETALRLRHAQRGAMGTMIETIIEAILLAREMGSKVLGINHFAELLRRDKSVSEVDPGFGAKG